jgi:hypothetical protein
MNHKKRLLIFYLCLLAVFVSAFSFLKENDELLRSFLFFPFIIVILLGVFGIIRFSIPTYLPKKYADVRKNIVEKPLKKHRISCTQFGEKVFYKVKFNRCIKLECFSTFFVLSSFGYCEQFSYTSIELEKYLFTYTLRTKTSIGKNVEISINKDLYTFFEQQKEILKNFNQ